MALGGLRNDLSGFGITESQLREAIEGVADSAVVETVLQGPDRDDSEVINGTSPGYTCADPTSSDPAATCLVTDTQNEAQIPVTGDIADVVAETPFAEDTTPNLTGIDCSNNNGGCSHVCTGPGHNGVCSCPNECWQLGSDQKICNIHPDMVELRCHPKQMEAHLARCVVAGMEEFKLGNSVCSSQTDIDGNGADNMSSAIKFNSCDVPGMGVDVDVNGDNKIDDGCISFVIDLDQCSMAVTADYENNK